MRVITVKNYNEMSKLAAEILIKELKKKSDLTIGLATGKTQLGVYKRLVKSKGDFSKIKSFNLDEFYPIKKTDKKSYYLYMFKNFFNKINIKKSNINLFA